MDKEFTIDDFSFEKISNELLIGVNAIIDSLNTLRDAYINYDKYKNSKISKKELWDSVIQLLPSSYNQTRNVSMNYEVLCDIYRQRKNHKLDEWRTFCEWIEHLPYSELIYQTSDENTVKVTGWRPISEYDRKIYNWVLVKMYDVTSNDQTFERIPVVAELRNDNKWYTKTDEVLCGEPRYFFDMWQLDK